MIAYYNEHDPKAAAWLRQLIKNGDITQGEVDERSITDVHPSDIDGFDRVHFFAGIGTWDYCLNQAGWDDRPIWTASLPCQPFSAAGKGLGKADERHLLPHFLKLVRECKPDTIIGEQVEAAIRHGWLDDLQANMEAESYTIGHCVLGAHSIGAPHIRQRLYWLANSTSQGLEGSGGEERRSALSSTNCWMADSQSSGLETPPQKCREQFGEQSSNALTSRCGVSGMGNAEHDGHVASQIKRSNGTAIQNSQARQNGSSEFEGASSSGSLSWVYCRDNKYRPIKSSIQPLAHGITKGMVHSSDPSAPINANATQEARAIRLKGYGNAIQAQTAIAFIRAYTEISL